MALHISDFCEAQEESIFTHVSGGQSQRCSYKNINEGAKKGGDWLI